MVTFEKVKKNEALKLTDHGFSSVKTKNEYELLRMKGPVTVVLFNSNKLLLQGAEDKVAQARDLLLKLKIGKLVQKEKLQFKQESGTIIGSDEALKGDTFGGLVVAAVIADSIERQKLKELGVADSKQLNDKEISIIAEQLKKIVKYHVISLAPDKYNKLRQKYNMTGLLNLLHMECASKLKIDSNTKHIVDQFPGCKTGDGMETKAESKYIEVAAASILARAEGIKQIDGLSRKLKIEVPMGSAHVKEALNHLKRKRLPFELFVKLDFKNVQQVLKQS
ncbi:ribonuclease HIII [Candidatus Woesearchaeota archaeon]|nr:ribonuclease HIII [Candidatus Woesearchaeota archaeon]